MVPGDCRMSQTACSRRHTCPQSICTTRRADEDNGKVGRVGGAEKQGGTSVSRRNWLAWSTSQGMESESNNRVRLHALRYPSSITGSTVRATGENDMHIAKSRLCLTRTPLEPRDRHLASLLTPTLKNAYD